MAKTSKARQTIYFRTNLEVIARTDRRNSSPQQYVVLYGGAAFEAAGSVGASGSPTPAEALRPKNSVTCLAPVGAAAVSYTHLTLPTKA